MNEYAWTDLLLKPEEAGKHSGEYGWFADNPMHCIERANRGHKDDGFYGRMISDDAPYTPFYLMKYDTSFPCFIPDRIQPEEKGMRYFRYQGYYTVSYDITVEAPDREKASEVAGRMEDELVMMGLVVDDSDLTDSDEVKKPEDGKFIAWEEE